MEEHTQYLMECLDALVITGEGAQEMLDDPAVSGESDAMLRIRVAQGRHAPLADTHAPSNICQAICQGQVQKDC